MKDLTAQDRFLERQRIAEEQHMNNILLAIAVYFMAGVGIAAMLIFLFNLWMVW
jgi:hypothetical protein